MPYLQIYSVMAIVMIFVVLLTHWRNKKFFQSLEMDKKQRKIKKKEKGYDAELKNLEELIRTEIWNFIPQRLNPLVDVKISSSESTLIITAALKNRQAIHSLTADCEWVLKICQLSAKSAGISSFEEVRERKKIPNKEINLLLAQIQRKIEAKSFPFVRQRFLEIKIELFLVLEGEAEIKFNEKGENYDSAD